jgi:hypothetical protein
LQLPEKADDEELLASQNPKPPDLTGSVTCNQTKSEIEEG